MAAVLARFTHTFLFQWGLKIPLEYAFPVEMFIWGWMFVVLDMPIYMAFEGRRFWPGPLWSFGIRRQRGRLLRLYLDIRRNDTSRNVDQHYWQNRKENADRRYLEALTDLGGFPLHRKTAFPDVISPTRLGNLINAYEQYSDVKYGLNAVFFWPRLWVAIDKDLREEIDNQQAQADGLLYLVTALIAGCVVLVSYAAIDHIAPGYLMYPEPPAWELGAAAGCLVGAAVIHRLSLYTHAQFGNLFKSVFDQKRSLLEVQDVTELIAEITDDPGLLCRIGILRNRAVWRLLRWHTVRLPGEKVNRRVRLP